MSDETFSLIMALTCLALIALLWVQFQRGRIMRKLLRSLEESQAKRDEEEKKNEASPPRSGDT